MIPFYPVSLNLVGRLCVVVGPLNDREAIEKRLALIEAGAEVRWIDDSAALCDEDVSDAYFVISTPQDEALSKRLRALADRHRFLLCCIDQPTYGFVAMAAIVKAGPVRVAISTAGMAPRVGKLLKNALQRVMDETFERFIDALAKRKTEMKTQHPSPNDTALRRAAMIEAADGFSADVRFTYPEWFEPTEGERT